MAEPSGTLMKKMRRHEEYVTIKPPRAGPIIEPSGKILVISPIGRSLADPN